MVVRWLVVVGSVIGSMSHSVVVLLALTIGICWFQLLCYVCHHLVRAKKGDGCWS